MAAIAPTPFLQFTDANGNPLSGGKLYTYSAGTSTPLATYTDSSGGTPNTNPVILDSRGQASVWLGSQQYKFVLKDATDVLIRTTDNITGVSGNYSNPAFQREVFTATAGQTVFILTDAYIPGALNLMVYTNGKKDAVGYDYVETDSTTVTFNAPGKSVGDVVEFYIGIGVTGSATESYTVGYQPAGTGAVATTVQSKLRESISVLDFGADPTGATDSTAAFIAAIAVNGTIHVPIGHYRIDSYIAPDSNPLYCATIIGETEAHIGYHDGRVVIDLTHNTTYFGAFGYCHCIKNICFINGVDVIHHTSQGIDENTSKLIDVFASSWTGTFFKGISVGNGSLLTWIRPVLISFNAGSKILDCTGMDVYGFDELTIYDGWFQGTWTVAFNPIIGHIWFYDGRFIPGGGMGAWFVFNMNWGLNCFNTVFGGEASNTIGNVNVDGPAIRFEDCYIYPAGNPAFNLLGAPVELTFNNCDMSPGAIPLLSVSPSMTSASLALLAKCRFGADQNPITTQTQFTTIPNTQLNAAIEIGIKRDVNHALSPADLRVTSGTPWMNVGYFTNCTYSAGVTDDFGTDPYGVSVVSTSVAAAANWNMGSGTPGISALTAGSYTVEMFVTVTGGPIQLINNTPSGSEAQYLSAGAHHVCVPCYYSAGDTVNFALSLQMAPSTTVTVSKRRVFSGSYRTRPLEFRGSAAPSADQWYVGDVVDNSAPAAAGYSGWVCTTAGTPGTWKGYGLIQV